MTTFDGGLCPGLHQGTAAFLAMTGQPASYRQEETGMATHAPQLVPQVQLITHVFCSPTPFLRQPQDSVKVVPAPPQQAAALISGTTPLSSLSARRAMILISFTSFRSRAGAADAAASR